MTFPPHLAERIRQAIADRTETLPPTGQDGAVIRRRRPPTLAKPIAPPPKPPRRGWNARTLPAEVEATFREAQHEHRA